MSEKITTFPVIPLRGLTIIPGTTVHFDISRKLSIKAAKEAMVSNKKLFVVAQKDPVEDTPGFDDIYKIGTIVEVKQLNTLPDDIVRVMVESVTKGEITSWYVENGHFAGEVVEIEEEISQISDYANEAYVRELKELVTIFNKSTHELTVSGIQALKEIDDIEELMSQTLLRIKVDYRTKQRFLEQKSSEERFSVLSAFLIKENQIAEIKEEIIEKVKNRLEKSQREHILREQMEIIKEELGDDFQGEVDQLEEKIKDLNANDSVKEKLLKELSRFKSYAGNPVEGNNIRTYIENMLELPWNNITKENPDLNNAEMVLNRDHYELKKVKERILEFLAVRQLTMAKNVSPIICLVGPPGTGKTSIAHSIAEALNKKYVRISLGGVTDESEIRGHRRTYVGAMPGRIVKALKEAGSANPLILLDEIDKMGTGIHGDPASAMLEVLDSEQNYKFRDNYAEIPIDLSKVLFIATANDLSSVPTPLLDRMEVIQVEGYTENEKFHIAKEHLIPKEFDKNGIRKSWLTITDEGINSIIVYYTREAGVRQLDREIGKICRKAASLILKNGKKRLKITSRNIEKYLGRKLYDKDMANEKNDVGIVRGLAWTAVGGTTLQIEVNTMPGKGQLKITGQLGDVMKESAQIALTYVRSIAESYGVNRDFFAKHDIHIHVPEGAVPKDGPSAGITMATAILSAVSGIKVNSKVAMTGEINLRGKVMPIGGLKEKLLAAKNAGIKTVVVPKKNEPLLSEISKEITGGMKIVMAEEMSQVLKVALVK